VIAYKERTDTQLVDLLKSGDHAAFTEIYKRFSGLLYSYAFKLTGDTDTAKDLVQELFISLWDKREKTELLTSLSSYLYSAVRYKFLKLIAHQKIKSAYAERFLNILEQGSWAIDHYITDKELAAEVEKLVSSLPKKQARIFALSRLEYRSHEEIAQEMELSEKTVKNIMSQAVKNLRLKIGTFLMLILVILFPEIFL